jgi:putative ABC transport system substrate-binding protein
MYHRAAYYVDRLLHGIKPESLPIEMPTKVDLTINVRTAKAIGVEIPRELLVRADRLID